MKIFKYPLIAGKSIAQASKGIEVKLPATAQLLYIGEQLNEIYLWCLVDPKEKEELIHTFYIIPTGVDIPDNAKYLKTIQTNGYFMWHVFMDKGK